MISDIGPSECSKRNEKIEFLVVANQDEEEGSSPIEVQDHIYQKSIVSQMDIPMIKTDKLSYPNT